MPYLTTLTSAKMALLAGRDADDQYLADSIPACSQIIEDLCGYNFDPRIMTRGFDVEPDTVVSVLDLRLWPLQELSSLVDADGVAFTSDQYLLYPKYEYPRTQINLVGFITTGTTSFIPSGADALIVAGTFVYHRDYPNAWKTSSVKVGTGGIDASSTSLPLDSTNLNYTSGVYNVPKIDVGSVIKIGTEWMAVTGPVLDTHLATNLTVIRGYNGSTAAAHSLNDAIAVWQVESVVEWMVRETVAASYSARKSAAGETVEPAGMGRGVTVDVPKRVLDKIKWPYYNYMRGTK